MSVMIAITTRDGSPPHKTFCHAMKAAERCGAILSVVQYPYDVCVCREKAVKNLLASPCSHLMFIDHDVLVPDDVVERLLELNTDIAAASVPSVQTVRNLQIPYVQCTDEPTRTGDRFPKWIHTWPEGVVESYCVGMGCVLIHRKVFEAMSMPWFKFVTEPDGTVLGEDTGFCIAARGLGFKIKVDGNLRVSHLHTIDIASLIVEPGEIPHDVTWQGSPTMEQIKDQEWHGSHVPALTKTGEMFGGINRVVEFGGGDFSTPLFLNDEVFGGVVEVVTHEPDRMWAEWLRSKYDDGRLLVIESLEVTDHVKPDDGQMVLVFVDSDSSHAHESRVTILEKLASMNGNCPQLVAIHDTEREWFDPWRKRFRYSSTYKPQDGGPWTTVASNNVELVEGLF